MKKILVFCDYYLPSVKSGGGMWTIANLVERFCDRYDFHIVTRNYDSPGDTNPYTTVKTGEWNKVYNACVYYAAADDLTKTTMASLVKEVQPDCIFLNSAFSTPVVKYLMVRREKLVPDIPTILAPCGELSHGGLKSKRLKKRAYLAYAKFLGLYVGVIWKASTEVEVDEIRSIFGSSLVPMIAPDLTPKTILPNFSVDQKPEKTAGSVKFVFLSRIVPKKNLKYFLELLAEINEGHVTFDIVGPQENIAYWAECLALIEKLPENIKVDVVGSVSYADGLESLCNNHFFVLPTLNENFGYVFIESLAAGSPLLISDQTVWGEVEKYNAGYAIPLSEGSLWIEIIKKCVAMGGDEYIAMANASRNYAVSWLADAKLEEATANVLEAALEQSKAK